MSKVIYFFFMISFGMSCYGQDDRDREPIIDMHMHTGLPHDVPEGTPSLCRPEPCDRDGYAVTDPEQLMEKTLEAMNRYNIVKGFLSGTDFEAVKKWSEFSPDRFIAAPFILEASTSHLEALKPEYRSGRFKGLGEIGTQLHGIPPNDPKLEAYFELAEELDLPVLIHTLGIGPYMPKFRSDAGNPLLLEDVLKRHPNIRLFVENGGFPYQEEMIAMMYQYPKLYVDVSTITWVIPRETFYDYLKGFMRAGLGKRILFGSDQMVWPDKIGAAIEAIEQAPFLSYEQKRDIFYNNAIRFLDNNGPSAKPIGH